MICTTGHLCLLFLSRAHSIVLLGIPLIPQKLRVHLHQIYTKFNKDWNSARLELLANISLLKFFADSNHVTAASVKAIYWMYYKQHTQLVGIPSLACLLDACMNMFLNASDLNFSKM